MATQDTGKFRNTKDQYYTKQNVAKDCVEIIKKYIPNYEDYTCIEPSAGSGAFMIHMPDSLGMDIDPKYEKVVKGDYLEWRPSVGKPILIFGNPPFGSQSSIAKAFIKHSCKYAKVIAFILPRSFTKPSMNRAFDSYFHCIYSEELPKDCFEVNGEEYDVPCVFQIWIKKDTQRETNQAIKEVGFRYVKNQKDSHISFRRVGGKAGTCYDSKLDGFSVQSHYFLKLDTPYIPSINSIIEKINLHVFPSNTVGPRSLSKTEANTVINKLLLECETSG